MVKVSVIMPVYNGANFLKNTCENLSKQTLDDFELICVNDGSVDDSLKLLKKLSKKYSFIKVINQDNQGSGKARNRGIDEAQGEYVAFLDADDIFIDEDALERMYDLGIKYNADMVAGNLLRITNSGKIIENPNYEENYYMYCSEIKKISPSEYGVPWAFYKNIFRRDFINEYDIRFPDLKRGQDPVFLAKILTNLDFILTVPVDLYAYNFESGGGPNNKINTYQKKYDYIKNYCETFRIFDNNRFNDSLVKYSETLFKFLSSKRNKKDKELFGIVHELFEDGNSVYFDDYREEILYLRLSLLNFFKFNLYDFFKPGIEENLIVCGLNKPIPDRILNKYSEIFLKYSNEEDRIFVSKEFVNTVLPEVVNNKTGILEELLSSRSWKITKPLRRFMNKHKR